MPDGLAPRFVPRCEGTAGGEVLEWFARELRAAREVEQALERLRFAKRALDVLALRLAHPAHEMKPSRNAPRGRRSSTIR